jgi:alanyl-tRNA synthetase
VIAVRRWERAKGLTRIQFMAGLRVVNDYRKANRTANAAAALFSAGRDDSPALLTRLIEENKKLARRVRELDAIASLVEAENLIRDSKATGGVRIIESIFSDRDGDSLKHLARALIAHPNVIALLGSRDGETARLVFGRSAEAAGDMNALMREACAVIDGRGGGKPDMAQGGGKKVEALEEALAAAARSLQH